MLDRIDLHVEVPLVDFRELSSTHHGESSAAIRERVITARKIQATRFKGKSATSNSAIGTRQVKAHCQIDSTGSSYLEHAMEDELPRPRPRPNPESLPHSARPRRL